MENEKKLSPEQRSMKWLQEFSYSQYMNGKGLDSTGKPKDWAEQDGEHPSTHFTMCITEKAYEFHKHSLITLLKQVTGMRLDAQRYVDDSKYAQGKVKVLREIERLLERKAKLSTPWKKVKPTKFKANGVAGVTDTVWNADASPKTINKGTKKARKSTKKKA